MNARALVAATVLAVFAGPALAADECRKFRIAVSLFDSAGRTALNVQSKGTREDRAAAEAAHVASGDALVRTAKRLRDTIRDPAALAALADLDRAFGAVWAAERGVRAWYGEDGREPGAEFEKLFDAPAIVFTAINDFLLAACRERGQ